MKEGKSKGKSWKGTGVWAVDDEQVEDEWEESEEAGEIGAIDYDVGPMKITMPKMQQNKKTKLPQTQKSRKELNSIDRRSDFRAEIETPQVQQNQKPREFQEIPISICRSTCSGKLWNICAEMSSDIFAERSSDISAEERRSDISADVPMNVSDESRF